MEREMARQVVEILNSQDGPTLSLLEVMAMTPIMSDGAEVYAIQKGDVTFLVWGRVARLTVKKVNW